MAKRRCAAHKRDGGPCGAPPLKGTDYCSAHSPKLPASLRFGSPEQAAAAGALGGRPRRPREIELIQEVAQEFKDDLRAVYADGLRAERGVVVGNDSSAHVEYVPDHAHRLRTAQEILDRLHGKARSAGEVPDRGVFVNLNLVTDNELREQAAALRRGLAAHRSVQPGGADAGGRA